MKKINILLSFLLVGVLSLAGFLGYTYLDLSKKVEVPDFLGKNQSEVFDWCGKLDSKYSCEFVYEPSKDINKDIVFQQSLNGGSILQDKIIFKVSSELIKPVDLPQLYNATRAEIEKWQSTNKIADVKYVDENSDTVSKGTVIRIEPTGNIYQDTPVTVYVSSGPEKKQFDDKIEVKAGEYKNLTVSQFETQVRSLGLVPNHSTSKDRADSSVKKGNIAWHGSGTYEPGETINYGICTEESSSSSTDIVVKAGTYTGKTEEEFKKAATDLGLSPNHKTEKDAYSDTVAKGNIVWHGSGTYVKNETFNYGLSLGKEGGSSTTEDLDVKENEYRGKTEEEFKKIATDLGLKPVHKESRDDYSDTIAKGSIISHGFGLYEKGEDFNYGLSLGKKGAPSTEDLYVTKDKYVGKSEEEFKKIATDLGLKPVHLTDRDAYSDTVAKGSVVTHGYGQYEVNEDFNYGLSLGKKDSSTPSTDDLYVTKDKYVGKSEEEFKKIATDLGLKPVHLSDRDAYSDTIAKGSIVTHGYGQYEKGENFNYGVSLGKKGGSTSESIVVSSGAYIGKTESEFKTIGTNLGLSPNHQASRDAYSDTVAQGSVVWHGSGTYVKNETFNYGLSLGKAPDNTVSVSSKAGSSESDFKAYIEGLGLVLGTKSTEYSDSVGEGKIIKNDTGTYKKGDKVNYTVSLGQKPVSTGRIMRPDKYVVGDTFDKTKSNMQNYLSVFTNVKYEGVTSTKGVGKIDKIEVGSYGTSYKEGDYPVDTPITVYIVNKQSN
ncbi:MAG: hypothetical protein IKS54_00830 [Erysipelotrichaceae bacterium]|nr:hypothetical protein [Erysipelotrichaceae bacterium]